MFALCFVITILSTALCIQTQEVPRLVLLKTAEPGDTVTLHCGVLNESIFILNWFKQSLGFIPQVVANRIYEKINYPSLNSRITVGVGTDFNLIIRDINKEDEANYFCNQGTQYKNNWKTGTFLTVKDGNDQRFISQTVVEQPVFASAQLGDPVALQCSVTTQRTNHSNQCQGEPSVYWFRSRAGPLHPATIFMNGNRGGECKNSSGPPSAQQSCVYTLPKNNVVSSDAGTYYCALAACGEAVFGNGTKLDIKEHNSHLVTVGLGILLACCLGVIIILLLTRNKKQVCQHCKGILSASYHPECDSGIQEPQDGETDSLTYAPLEFSGRKTKGGKKKSERIQESVYSAVRETCN